MCDKTLQDFNLRLLFHLAGFGKQSPSDAQTRAPFGFNCANQTRPGYYCYNRVAALCTACSAQDGRGQYTFQIRPVVGALGQARRVQCGAHKVVEGPPQTHLQSLSWISPLAPPIKPVLLGTHGQQNAAARPLFALSPPCPCPPAPLPHCPF